MEQTLDSTLFGVSLWPKVGYHVWDELDLPIDNTCMAHMVSSDFELLPPNGDDIITVQENVMIPMDATHEFEKL
jgi:hypothetical protein